MDAARYDEALSALERLRPRAERRRHEHAIVLQTYAHLYARLDRYPEAIAALEECLALAALPPAASQQARYLQAQLQLASADYPAAVTTLERWFEKEREPTPAAHALAGSAYAYAGHTSRAIEHLGKAIALARTPDENWYRQLLAVYYEAGKYQAAARLLQQLIRRYPADKDYWLQLAGVYHELGNDTRSLAIMELAYQRGLLSGETELLNLARFYLYADLPFQAGQLLDKALHEGQIAPAPGHWRLLVDAWVRAREPEQALAAIKAALDRLPRPDAELHLLRAQLLAEQEAWSGVIQATDTALAAGDPAMAGKAWLLRGYARYHQQSWQQAQAAFARAGEFDETREQAGRWLELLEAEQRRTSRSAHTTLSRRVHD